jgi:4-(gamma-glutamylamino)butanal dehydrogenase
MTAAVSDPVTAIDWRQRAADLTINEGMFIGGERRAAIDGSTKAVQSARDGSKLIELAWAQPADADAAVAAAREAFDHGPWSRLHPRDRGQVLQEFANRIEQHRDEIALLISLEMGKPIRHAYQIELRAIIRCLRF